ncbi:MAG: hypothetical protein ACLQVF_28640 [Isosphaeraceae bacterium]
MAGCSKRAFVELLGKHGAAVMDYAASELQHDLGHA